MAQRRRVAVVGSGVSGLTAAWLLRHTHDVTVLEVDDRLGGHAHSHDVTATDGRTYSVDSGFIVHNDRTYPLLRRLFAALGVQTRPTEMSMSIRCDGCGLEYAGGRGAAGIVAQPRRLADPRFVRLLSQVRRFQRQAKQFLASTPERDETTYRDFLAAGGFGTYFQQHYAVPIVSCVWSSGTGTALDYPARYLFAFLDQHGFLTLRDAPQWRTVVGGSQAYVRALAEQIGDVRTGVGARMVTRKPDGVQVLDSSDRLHVVDQVVLATHADDALALLTDATDDERRVLGAFGYSANTAVLHTDASVLPRAPRARASWNYRLEGCGEHPGSPRVSYWMNRLQGHEDAADTFMVSLNDDRPDPATVIAQMTYTHPRYTLASVAAQRELAGLTTTSTAFAGAHHGWGFHEDGCRSGVDAARRLGAAVERAW
ncbi:MAG: FAD-dependent oxidoreductase [Nocardioidaceae bacterium]|nr:FAD-dependent oxidoreductase [Nocardioidaceae bacterium]